MAEGGAGYGVRKSVADSASCRHSGVIAAALLLLSPAGAIAAPKRFDCNLVTIETKETKALGDVHVDAENRLITVMFDAPAEARVVQFSIRLRDLEKLVDVEAGAPSGVLMFSFPPARSRL